MGLFHRSIGKSGEKIAIHRIQSITSEVSNGRLTPAQAVIVLGLSGGDEADYYRLLNQLSLCTDQLATSARVFNYLCLGEMGEKTYYDYTDESLFWAMLEAE